MRTCPSLVSILSLTVCLAACEHASTATEPTTPSSEITPVAAPAAALPKPAPTEPKPSPAPGAEPTAKPKLFGGDCTNYRPSRAAPKWGSHCERSRVTKKPAEKPEAATGATQP